VSGNEVMNSQEQNSSPYETEEMLVIEVQT